jgi:hypothetical protein
VGSFILNLIRNRESNIQEVTVGHLLEDDDEDDALIQ